MKKRVSGAGSMIVGSVNVDANVEAYLRRWSSPDRVEPRDEDIRPVSKRGKSSRQILRICGEDDIYLSTPGAFPPKLTRDLAGFRFQMCRGWRSRRCSRTGTTTRPRTSVTCNSCNWADIRAQDTRPSCRRPVCRIICRRRHRRGPSRGSR